MEGDVSTCNEQRDRPYSLLIVSSWRVWMCRSVQWQLELDVNLINSCAVDTCRPPWLPFACRALSLAAFAFLLDADAGAAPGCSRSGAVHALPSPRLHHRIISLGPPTTTILLHSLVPSSRSGCGFPNCCWALHSLSAITCWCNTFSSGPVRSPFLSVTHSCLFWLPAHATCPCTPTTRLLCITSVVLFGAPRTHC